MKKILLVVMLGTLLGTVAYGGIFSRLFRRDRVQSVEVQGSDTMVNLGQALAENFMKVDDTRIAVTGGGSGTGIAAMINGTVNIAQASRQARDTEYQQAANNGIQMKEWTVGFDGITVVVNVNNPISGLTKDQVRAIYIGEVTNWKQVGGKDQDIVVLSRQSSSGTYGFFRDDVLRRGNSKGPEEFTETALFMPSTQAIVDETIRNEAAIGYIGMGYMSNKMKSLSIDGVMPSVENVANNSYTIARGLYWYTDGEPEGGVKKFLDWTLSDAGQKVVASEGFVPIR